MPFFFAMGCKMTATVNSVPSTLFHSESGYFSVHHPSIHGGVTNHHPPFFPSCVLEWSHFKQAANMFQLKLRSQLVWRRRREKRKSRRLLKLQMKNSLLIFFINFFYFYFFFLYLQGFLVILIEDILIICILCSSPHSLSLSLILVCKFSHLKKKN